MQFHCFLVPMACPEAAGELNRFLAGHRVLTVQREFVQNGRESAWAFCVEFLEGPVPASRLEARRDKADYKEVLPPEQFAVFARMRALRKELAARDAVPAYSICTDAQLAEMARQGTLTRAALLAIPGFGDAKADKYGEPLMSAHRGVTPSGGAET